MDIDEGRADTPSRQRDFRDGEVFNAELIAIDVRRNLHGLGQVDEDCETSRIVHTRDTLSGLAFSGGGVRSATFCLGVAQALVKSGLFKQFDYLSTVSGGGYAGGTLSSSLIASNSISPALLEPPILSSSDPAESGESRVLQHLRNHSKYLAPTGKGSALHILALVILGLTTNILLITPALIGISFVILAMLSIGSLEHAPFWMGVAFALWTSVYAVVVSSNRLIDNRWFGRPHWLAATVFVLLCLAIAAFLCLQPIALEQVVEALDWLEGNNLIRAIQLLIGSLGAFGVVISILGSILQRFESAASRVGRIALGLIAPLVLWALVLTLVASLTRPCTWYRLEAHSGLSIENSGFSHWLSDRPFPRPRFSDSCVLMDDVPQDDHTKARQYGPVAGSVVPGQILPDGSKVVEVWVQPDDLIAIILIYSAFALGLTGLALLINVNATSLHAFYRDRLRDAYVHGNGGSSKVMLSELPESGPYHLLNAAINIQDSKQNLRGRNADSFFFSKFFCGSSSTGWCATKILEGVDPEIDLAATMAISGAAVAPNQGVATNRTSRFLMALSNARLGYWMVNPRRLEKKAVKISRRVSPYYFVLELLGKLDEKRNRIYLSDGGHIENLGAYELLRRRCRHIVIVDAEQDGDGTFHGLAHLMRLVKIDFDFDIEFSMGDIRRDVGGFSKAHAALGYVDYHDGTFGDLLYIKASVTGDEVEYVQEYRRRFKDFPHESTTHQFFSEEQFEAYRALGFHIASGLSSRYCRNMDQFFEHLRETLAIDVVDKPAYLEIQSRIGAIRARELEMRGVAQSELNALEKLTDSKLTLMESAVTKLNLNDEYIALGHCKNVVAVFRGWLQDDETRVWWNKESWRFGNDLHRFVERELTRTTV